LVYYEHFREIRIFLENMLYNPDAATRQAGARLICLAGFRHSEAQDLVEQVVQGDAALRRGAAQVYARNLEVEELQNICEAGLRTLMTDPDAQVRSHVAECFIYLGPEHLDSLQSFFERFINSPALIDGARYFLEYFAPLAADMPNLALLAVERILDEVGSEITDIRTSAARLESDLARLPLAVYTHAGGPRVKSEAMATFERLLLMGSRTARQALQDWDRR
jgi:hypothetical protein